MSKLKFKYKMLMAMFYGVMITSLWPNNIYLLVSFSLLTYIVLPIKRWWNSTALILLVFSLFYSMMAVMNNQYRSGFVLITLLIAPVGLYRFGQWLMYNFYEDEIRQKLFMLIIATYLLPLFILTFQDVQLVGVVNVSREMMGDLDSSDSLAATLYGMMSSVGIACIASLFAKRQSLGIRLIYILLSLLSLFVVIHLVNRTGLIVFITCLIAALVVSTNMKLSKIIPLLILMGMVIFVVLKTGIIADDIFNAYMDREMSVSGDASQLGGRSDIWADAFNKLVTHPFGWERVRYAHNLWLDIARVGGWLALLLFVIPTFKWIRGLFRLAHKATTPFVLIILSINAAMLLSSFVEPVIEGSVLFFSLLMMMWGVTDYLSKEIQ